MSQYSEWVRHDLHATAEKGGFDVFDDEFNIGQHIFIGKTLPSPYGNYYDLMAENNSHPLIIGCTGSAKTTSIINTNIMARGCSCVVIDPKGETASALHFYLCSQGYEVVVFDPFNVSRIGSSSYDPVAYLDPADPLLTDKIINIAKALLVHSGLSEPHWVNAALDVLVGIIAYVIINTDEKRSLLHAHEILQGGIRVVQSVAAAVCANFPGTLAYRKLARCADWDVNNKEAQSIISTLLVQLQFLDSEPIRRTLTRGTFQFTDLLNPNRKVAVFVVLPLDKLESHNKYHRLMITQVISTVSSGGRNSRNPIDLYIDEAGTIGALPILSNAVGNMRGVGLRIWTCYQTLSQIKRDFPMDWENIIGNAGTILLLKVMDNETAEYFSQKIGRKGQESFQTRALLKECGRISRGSSYFNDSMEERLLYPENLCQLLDNLGIVFTDGSPALFMKAPYYNTHPFCDVLGLV